MNLKLKRTPGLYLVGFTASGKSTVGRALAHRLGWNFFDLYHEMEAAEKISIAELFHSRGEPAFRSIESAILRQHVNWIERGRPSVVALGEGTFLEPANRELACSNGLAIWLDCPLPTVGRRMGQDAEKLAALYQSRRETYALSDVHVVIESDDPAMAVEAILNHPLFR